MGMVAVQVYAKDIFAKAAPSLSSHFCSVMFALVLLFGCLLSAIFTDRFGRKVSFCFLSLVSDILSRQKEPSVESIRQSAALTLGSEVPSAYTAVCGIQGEAN